jgi:hypothetical protein
MSSSSRRSSNFSTCDISDWGAMRFVRVLCVCVVDGWVCVCVGGGWVICSVCVMGGWVVVGVHAR